MSNFPEATFFQGATSIPDSRVVHNLDNETPYNKLEHIYHKVASRSTCYYSENQVFGGATNRDMSLNETCYYSKIQKFWTLKSQLVTCPKGYLFAWILIKILLCLDFKSFFAWILASFFGFHKSSKHGFHTSLLDFQK